MWFLFGLTLTTTNGDKTANLKGKSGWDILGALLRAFDLIYNMNGFWNPSVVD
jgi:hypothetical protein